MVKKNYYNAFFRNVAKQKHKEKNEIPKVT